MKASTLIGKLAVLMQKHGDLPVKTSEWAGDSAVDITQVYATSHEERYGSQDDPEPTEFYIG